MISLENRQKEEKEVDNKEVIEYVDQQIKFTQSKAAAVQEVSKLKRDVEFQKKKIKMQSGEIQRLHSIVEDLSARLESVEINNTRRHMTLTNLYTDRKKM